jgi:signal transduction histidine kinase
LNRNRAFAGGWIGGAVALLVAVACAVLLAQLLIDPPASDLRALALYLALSGAATIVGGAIAMRLLDRRARSFGIQTKSVLAALTGTAVALLNILIVARLMFVSTSHDLRLLVALVAFSTIVTVFFALWVASAMASRLHAIAAVVRRLAEGRYDERAVAAGGDEVAALAADVNALAARLATVEQERAALDAERRELTASISHDLRTPLASLSAMVEALDDEVVADRAEVRRYYVTMRREIERLSRMIDTLFELAQIDAGALRLNLQPVALEEIAAEVVDAMRAQAQRAAITIEAETTGDLPPLMLDGARIERAIANLVRNALEHTPPEGRIVVRVERGPSSIVLTVRDTGEGIAPEDLPHIWRRFYRGDKSRTRHGDRAEGAGLGLAITRGIIESHAGTIEASSTVHSGTTMRVHIPLMTAPAQERVARSPEQAQVAAR